jgi:hypothetical protein
LSPSDWAACHYRGFHLPSLIDFIFCDHSYIYPTSKVGWFPPTVSC